MRTKIILSAIFFATTINYSFAQQPQATKPAERKDKADIKEYRNDFYQKISTDLDIFNQPKEESRKSLAMDYSNMDIPKSASEFKSVWINEPVSQGMTNTCWSFATTSFYEAEIYRLTKQQIRLSEMFTVYYEYVEKTKEFVRTRGESFVGEGSETNAVAKMMKKYGVLPQTAYSGLKIGQPYPDHRKMFDEIYNYLQSMKSQNAWNETQAVATVKSIMNFHIGEPPSYTMVNGRKLTPLDYMKDVTTLNPDEYVDFMSLMEKPYWTQAEYKVPDNWWRDASYYNLPLDDYMNIIKNSIANGYTISIGGDVSESGINSKLGVAMVPTYDIPSAYIDENARQLRFSIGTTTDDHALHLVGYLEKPNGMWYLIKDSGSSGHNNQNSKGYYYYHEDFVKLKMMSFTIHKDAVKNILVKFSKN